jgi:hypothetical protein
MRRAIASETPVFAPPSLRRQAALFLLTVLGLSAIPVVNHFRGDDIGRPNKDYPLWYLTGQQFVNGDALYPTEANAAFPFMYPPFAAMVLGVLSLAGPTVMLGLLILLNAASLALAIELTVRLVCGRGDVPLIYRTLPAGLSLFLVGDMFMLGQPNLGLYCLIVGGLMLVRKGFAVAGGSLFAIAAAAKAFPVLVLAYLAYRRMWRASAAMVLGIAALLVLAPAPVRGFERNLVELKTWADGMLFRQTENGFGQRPEQSTSWRNQSLSAVAHRFLRPADAEADAFGDAEPMFVNVVDTGYKNAGRIVLALSGLLGLAYIAVMPGRRRRTRETDALETGLLLTLVTLGTPYAFSYYFVWLLLPFTLCLHYAITAKARTDRRIAWATGIASVVLYAVGAPITPASHVLMAVGTMFWAAVVLLVGMGTLLVRVRLANAVVEPGVRADAAHRLPAGPKMIGVRTRPAVAATVGWVEP